MQKDLERYQLGDNSALLAIQKQFILSHYSSVSVAHFIEKEAKLSSIKNTVKSLNEFHILTMPLINRCLSQDYYSEEEAEILKNKLLDLQAKNQEIVIAVIPFTLDLLKNCQSH